MYREYFKRPMDIFLSLSAILVLSPALLILAALVKANLGNPVIFKQERPGLNEKIFTLYKFRTMTEAKDENGRLLPDSMRLTKFGKFLRSSSLDELPELWNILAGDMGIVGPRPLMIKYLPLYNEHQRRRHEVRPGLTGLAQVCGRNTLDWEDKFEIDLEYVNNITFLGDCKIILRTVNKVFKREGINSKEAATVKAFEGNKTDENK